MRPLTGSVLPYTLSQMMNPRASNTLGAYNAFHERLKYQNIPYFLDLPDPLHSWYEKLYYGRVDPIQNPIFLRNDSSFIKQFSGDRSNQFALSFVVDAFKDLQQHLITAADAGVISSTSFYYQIEAAGSLVRPIPAYNKIRDEWGEQFFAYLRNNPGVMRHIVDLQSFIKEVLNYMRRNTNDRPLTMSGFVVSNYSSPMMSGLSVELVNANYAGDSQKFKNYIMDPNFKYFVKAARQFGFYVDRNGPWKLTAAVASYPMSRGTGGTGGAGGLGAGAVDPTGGDPMLYPKEPLGIGEICPINIDTSNCGGADTYMGNYGLGMGADGNLANFFDTCYYRTYAVDLQILQNTFRDLYNIFAGNYPIAARGTSTDRSYRIGSYYDVSPGTRSPNIIRRRATAASVTALDDSYWLDVYFKIRLQEASLGIKQYDHQFKEILDVYRNFGITKAMRHINNLIKPYLYNCQLGKRALTRVRGPVTMGTVSDMSSPGGGSY